MGQNKVNSKKYDKCASALPILSGTIAAILTEGKTVREMEMLGVFLSAIAHDVFLIVNARVKIESVIGEEIII